MIPHRALPDLLSAERNLARFDTLLADPPRARRHACDAARRSALAMAALDGALVAADDLLLALVSPEEVDLPRRTEAAAAAAQYRVLLALPDGLGTASKAQAEPPKDNRLCPETAAAWSPLAAEARRLLAKAQAALHGGPLSGGEPAAPKPWTLPWAENIHAGWYEARHGRRPAPWPPETQETAQDALHTVEEALRTTPGVAGAARAIHRLHAVPDIPPAPPPAVAGEDEHSRAIRRHISNRTGSGWWPSFARMIAPHLIARACRTTTVSLPVSAWWSRESAGYRIALGGSEDDWIVWMAHLTATATEGEIVRSSRIEARHASWIAATAMVPRLPKRRNDTRGPTLRHRAGSRRSTGRLPKLLELLWEQPVVNARGVERRLGMTYRSALDLIQDLEKAGVLLRATDRKLDRLWRATTP